MLTAIYFSTFAAVYCLYLQSSGSPKLQTANNSQQIPKDTILHQQRCNILHCSQPTLYRTSQFQTLAQPSHSAVHLTANVNSNGSFVLCVITWTLHTGELLGSGLDCFLYPVKASTYLPTPCVKPTVNPVV